MTVYVDDMRAQFGRMVMCHMFADTDDELHAMANLIGVARRWHQRPPKASWSHYDIALSKRALAVKAGAIEIRWRDLPAMTRWKAAHPGEPYPAVEVAQSWFDEWRARWRAPVMLVGSADDAH